MKVPEGAPANEVRFRFEDTESTFSVSVAEGAVVLLGRDEQCDVSLRTARASREHAELRVTDGTVWVTDKSSANGTFVNESPIEHTALQAGDVLRIGTCRITIESVATATAPLGAADGGAPEASRPTAPPERRERSPVRPKSRGGSGGLFAVLLLIALATAVCFFAIEYRELLPHWARSVVNTVVGDLRELEPSTGGPEGGAEDGKASTGGVGREMRELRALEAWGEVLGDLPAAGDAPDQGVLERLRAFQLEFPDAALRHGVPDMMTLFERARVRSSALSSPELVAVLDTAEEEQRFGQVIAVAEFLTAVTPEEAERERWRLRADEAEANAAVRFSALETRLDALVAASKPGQALQMLLGESERFGGTAVYRRKLPLYVERSARPAESGFRSDPAVVDLLNESARAFEECRFADMRALGYALLARQPTADDRAELAEALVEATHLEQMFQEFLDTLKKGPVEVSLSDVHKGRIIRVGREEVEYEIDYKGRPVQRRKRPWAQIEPLKKYALFRGVSHRPGGVLGLVLFAFRVGHEDGAHDALQRLRRSKGGRDLVDSFLARRFGERVPKGGFVFHEGRFVTPEGRAQQIEQAKERRRESRLARKRMQELRRDGKLMSFVTRAKDLRRSGFFGLAQQILLELAKRFPKTPPGIEAQGLVDDPLLARHALEENGPSANRLDMFFLAEGYPAEDEFQESFLVVSNRAMNLLCSTEPYKSYRPYFNFFAVQLASAGRGVDREPGDVQQDTALDGKIEWDVFTVDRDKVRALLARMGEAGKDQQAVALGNDFASVATGGGGVASVCKTVLSVLPHEVGHSLGGLLDEYDHWPGNDPQRAGLGQRPKDPVPTTSRPPNVMRGSDRDDVLKNAAWRKWLEAPEDKIWNGAKVGVFEGADHTPFNAWRPQANCKMRTSGVGFCVVCMEQMVKMIYRYVRPIDRVEPETEDLDLKRGERLDFRAWPLQPLDHSLTVRWYLGRLPDDPPQRRTGVATPAEEGAHLQAYRVLGGEDGGREVGWLRWRDVEPGRYRLRLEVTDPTPWVLTDDEGLLREERSWYITVHPRVE